MVLFGTLSLGLVVYLNFKYSYSIPEAVGNFGLHEVRERDYFFIASFSVWGLWAGIGLVAIWNWLARNRFGTLLRASPILVLALVPLALNWASRAGDYAARDWAYNILMSVEPYGVLFTTGDNDTFPLWYLQEVEAVRRDVTVVIMQYLETPWYTKQIRDLARPCPPGVSADDDPTRIICQRPYEPDSRAEYTTAQLQKTGCEPIAAEGGFYAVLRCSDWNQEHGFSSSKELAHDILNKAHVAVVPGTDFGIPQDLRLAFCNDRYDEGIDRLRRYFSSEL